MSYSKALIKTARKLAKTGKKPQLTDLRRAVSTAYYAVFSAACASVTIALCGPRSGRRANEKVWDAVYRSIGHEQLIGALLKGAKQSQSFGPSLAKFAPRAAKLKELRHKSDYDPAYRLTRQDALSHIDEAESALADLGMASAEEQHSFAISLLVKTNDRP